MIDSPDTGLSELTRQLAEAEATVQALLSGEIDAVLDVRSNSPVVLMQAQHALRESEERYRQIVEGTTDGIVKVDHEGVIGFVNGRLAEMLGYVPDELVGRSLSMLVSPAEWGRVLECVREREPSATSTFDTVYRDKSGAEVFVNMACSPARDEEGQFTGALGFVRDVTESKKLHAQLIVSDRMASVGTLAAGVAHEINNPLAAIVANLEFVAEGLEECTIDNPLRHDIAWTKAHVNEPLADARAAAERVRFIVRDLMIFSRSPNDEPNLAVDVNAALESSLRMGWNEIRHRAVLVRNLGEVPLVAGNQARLGQVFLNLIVNAAQSMPIGHLTQHELRVSTYQSGDNVVIEIADTGSGIAPDAIGRIFDAFYTTKDVGAGTGLGLAICQRIVTDLHGTLTVSSSLGTGSTFRVALPIASQPPLAEPGVHTPGAIGRGARILVIDDEEMVGRIVQRVLGDSYEIIVTTSAREALSLIESGHVFDAILCDLMMPNMTGMELHQTLMRQSPPHALRMLFLTGGAFTPEAQQFLAEAERAHIDKPFDLQLLRAGVQDFLTAVERTA